MWHFSDISKIGFNHCSKQIRAIFCALMLLGVAFTAVAQERSPQEGKAYLQYKQSLPTASEDKVEVILFFAYYCPHCHALEPLLEKWMQKNNGKVVLKRVHVLQPGTETQMKLFFSLDAMGLVDKFNSKAFKAYHVEKNRLLTDEQVMKFVVSNGIDRNQFQAAYQSFSVRLKSSQIPKMMETYAVDAWPTLVIHGQYQTSPSMALSDNPDSTEQQRNEACLKILDYLVDKAAKHQ